MDEPVFFAEDSSEVAEHFDVPEAFTWAGSVPESSIDPVMPTIYMDWAVAERLHSEGQRSIETDLEVAGILLGTRSADNQIIKVSHIAVAKDEDSSPVHFKFTYSVWDDLIDQMDQMSHESGEELLLLGWYHTHPNMAVFLSRYDLRTHRDFARPYQFALVLAPKAGTSQTAVGFFCNRGEGTPLLPGVRLYGVPRGKDVGRALPWGFQAVEAEGVYEGEGGGVDESGVTQMAETIPEVQQLGVVRMEDPDWLTLGEDRSEGPVLEILEAMAASVVETKQDRIGVLLGTKTKDNHITITRVRFLGTMGEGPEKERADILGALRFMAESFPAHREQKILGVVRIVSPHRFRRGDAYDPVEHNIRIALLLGEVGYDLDQVPFQVGIAMYPGIEEDAVFFQVFAQHKTSRPVPLMSMRALAPPEMNANERYEPVDGPIFNIDEEPCRTPPRYGAERHKAKTDAAKKAKAAAPKPAPLPRNAARDEYVDPTTTGTDWDSVETDSEASTSGGVPLVLVGLGVVVAVLLGAILLFLGDDDPPEPGELGGGSSETPVAIEGEPYEYSITGCGAGWNPTRACRPLQAEGGVLVEVKRLPAYDAATFEPLEAWLAPDNEQERPKVRLERKSEGATWVFSVSDEGQRWADFWGDGNTFKAELILLPHGAELSGRDEWANLRRAEPLLLRGDKGEAGEDPSEHGAPSNGGGAQPPPAAPASEASFIWNGSGSTDHRATYDRTRQAFTTPLFVEGEGGDGTWTASVFDAGRGGLLGRGGSASAISKGTRWDLAPALVEILRDPKLSQGLSKVSGKRPEVTLSVAPPDGSGPLRLTVALRGEAASVGAEHRICVEAVREDGQPLVVTSGDATNDVVGEFTVNPVGGRKTFAERVAFTKGSCSDGNSTRYANVSFGDQPMKMVFRYTGNDEGMLQLPAPYTFQKDNDPLGLYSGAGVCFKVLVTLDPTGNQSRIPKITKTGSYVDGRCR